VITLQGRVSVILIYKEIMMPWYLEIMDQISTFPQSSLYYKKSSVHLTHCRFF